MAIYAHLKPESHLNRFIPDGYVPLVHMMAIRPRDHTAPPCYLVAGFELEPAVVDQLAQYLYEKWRPECESIDQARAYICDPAGVPIQVNYFSSFSFTAPHTYLLM